MPAGSLPEKLRNWATPGEGRRLGLGQALTWIVSGLDGKLGCVRGRALVRSGRLEQQDFIQKKALSRYLGNSPAVAALAKPLLVPPPLPPQRPCPCPCCLSGGGRTPTPALWGWLVKRKEEVPPKEESSRAQGVTSPQKE